MADTVAVSVHVDICKFVLVTEFLHDVHYQVLLSAVAGSLNHLGCEARSSSALFSFNIDISFSSFLYMNGFPDRAG